MQRHSENLEIKIPAGTPFFFFNPKSGIGHVILNTASCVCYCKQN